MSKQNLLNVVNSLVYISHSHVVNLRHVKEPKSDVEVATFGKILGYFSPTVPPSAAGVRSRPFRCGGHLVAGVGTF